jgi:hypothetical protein
MEIMEVTLIRENEDGSSDYTIEVTLKEKEDLIRFAIMFMLRQIIKEGQLYDPSESSLDNPGGRNKDSVHGKSKQSRKSTQYSHGPEAA